MNRKNLQDYVNFLGTPKQVAQFFQTAQENNANLNIQIPMPSAEGADEQVSVGVWDWAIEFDETTATFVVTGWLGSNGFGSVRIGLPKDIWEEIFFEEC